MTQDVKDLRQVRWSCLLRRENKAVDSFVCWWTFLFVYTSAFLQLFQALSDCVETIKVVKSLAGEETSLVKPWGASTWKE